MNRKTMILIGVGLLVVGVAAYFLMSSRTANAASGKSPVASKTVVPTGFGAGGFGAVKKSMGSVAATIGGTQTRTGAGHF